jgi:hypothetical protein
VTRRLYDLTIVRNGIAIERVSTHLDLDGNQDDMRFELRKHLHNAALRSGRDVRELTVEVRAHDKASLVFPPYAITGDEGLTR